jgi:hypothetical protein
MLEKQTNAKNDRTSKGSLAMCNVDTDAKNKSYFAA